MKLKLNWRGKILRLGSIAPRTAKPTRHQLKLASLCILAIGCSWSPGASAAERLTFRAGPLRQSVSVDDLEEFAETGKLSPALKPYRFLLTPQVKQILSQSLRVDPSVADTFFEELFRSSDGQQLVQQLRVALPGSTTEELRQGLSLAIRQTDALSSLDADSDRAETGLKPPTCVECISHTEAQTTSGGTLSVINFLRVYPDKNLTVNLPAAAGIALQLNTSYLQSKILSPKLKQDLKGENASLPNLDPSVSGNESVFKRTFVLHDKIRERTIPVDLYYSIESQGPLVVMSHGFAADRKFLTYLALHLASYGLTVASVEHSGSNVDSLLDMAVGVSPNDLLPAAEFIDRPKDITFVLNELERITSQRAYLKDKFNTEQVVVVGHSFGGYTALSLAGAELNLKDLRAFCKQLNPFGRAPADWLQCAAAKLPYSKIRLRDRRVQKAIAFNPIVGNIFGKNGLAKVDTPTLLLASSDDAITPPTAHQLQPFRKLKGEKYLLSVIGGTHMSVTDIGNSSSPVGRSTLVRELMGEEAEPLRQVVRGVSLAFIHQDSDPNYQPFLTPAYVQSLSTTAVSLRLSTKLPLKTRAWIDVLHFGSEQITLRKPEQEPIAERVGELLASARKILPQAQYSFGQLDRLFTGFLIDYNRHSDRLS